MALEVRDAGSGIAPEVLPRIFDPFFTTKEPGQGTGLGLTICHRIVASMRGEIRVSSGRGRGTSFTVLLPRAVDGQPRSSSGTSAAVAAACA